MEALYVTQHGGLQAFLPLDAEHPCLESLVAFGCFERLAVVTSVHAREQADESHQGLRPRTSADRWAEVSGLPKRLTDRAATLDGAQLNYSPLSKYDAY